LHGDFVRFRHEYGGRAIDGGQQAIPLAEFLADTLLAPVYAGGSFIVHITIMLLYFTEIFSDAS
jgi:hypothetical protein